MASRVILVRPTGFGPDPDTAATNAFQRPVNDPDIRHKAEEEFDVLLGTLDRCGIGTTVLDPVDPRAPNGVFPNNWFSTDAAGNVLLYPMHNASRRTERDPKLDAVLRREGFAVKELLDFSPWEEDGIYLEGTGSLVLDRAKRMAYANLSPRTSEAALDAWCMKMNYESIGFNATVDGTLTGQPVYHTNVVLSIGEGFALLGLEAMPYPGERNEVMEELEKAGKEIIPFTVEQMHAFVGNALALRSLHDVPFIFLSETAFQALIPKQRIQLEQFGQLVPVDVPTIEAVGGGSVRCMMAENFLALR